MDVTNIQSLSARVPLKKGGKKIKSSYPIFSVENNEIRSINGDLSYSYEIQSIDLEQINRSGRLSFYSEIKNFLNSTSEKTWFKFYKWGQKTILNTNEINPLFPECTIHPLSNSEEAFLGGNPAFSDINFYENYLSVNLEYWRFIHIDEFMDSSFECILDEFNCDYIVTFKRVGDERARKELSQKRRSQGVTLNSSHQNHEGEEAYDEANSLLKGIISHGEGLFKASVWFVPKAQSLEELNEKTLSLLKALKQRRAKAFVETSALDYVFKAALIGTRPSFMKANPTDAAYLSNLLPLNREYLHKDGLSVYSRDGSEIGLNLYDTLASNQNWLISGQSGEGKSFLGASLLYHLSSVEDARIGVFDLGGSLRRVAMYLGGVDLSTKFNPLQVRCPIYLKNFILSVVGKDELTKKEQGHLFEIIKTSLNEGISSFRGLIECISKEFSGFEYFFSELWEYFSDDLIQAPKIFYIDTVGMPEALIAPYLIFAKALSESQEGKIVNFYDECWSIINMCPEIIRHEAKTGRKNLIGNIFLTQEIVELSRDFGDVAKAIIGNTYGKLYFHQPDLGHPILSSFEKEVIQTVKSKKGEYSEFFFSSPDYKKVARLYASPLMYELCHSENSSRKKQEDFINEYSSILSFKEAMDKWVRFVYE